MADKTKVVKIVLEVIKYVVTLILGALGGGLAVSCIG